MSDLEKLMPDDAVLLRYLLGALPADEAEPIEGATVVDDDLAARLNAMEHDLVDRYVRGELEGGTLARFHTWYLSSPVRVQKVELARAFLRVADIGPVEASVSVGAAPAAIAAPEVNANVNVAPKFLLGGSSGEQKPAKAWFDRLSDWSMLGFATAVILLIVTVGFLSSRNKRLRNEVAETKKQTTELAAKLNEEHAAATANTKKGGAPDALAHGLDNVATVTMFLPAPTRGASTVPKVDVPAGTGLVVLSLGLGSSDEKTYRVQLMNPATQQVLWHSGVLRPGSDGTYVSVTVPAHVLRSQMYLIELMHDAANGAPELLGTYPFRVEVK
ncbi:MAG TPA: hypothetical protein VGJ06_22025 [Candidatus Acidoferrum sp.]|jgi:hypothetical protein